VLIAVLAGVWWLVSRKPQEPEVAHVQTQPSLPISRPTVSTDHSLDGSTPPDQPVTVPSTEPGRNIPDPDRQPDVSRIKPPITTQTPVRPAISVPAAAIALNLVATRGEGGGNTLTLYSDTPKAIIELPKDTDRAQALLCSHPDTFRRSSLEVRSR
jgi:hypothetical protein